jgi:hypothetical protein
MDREECREILFTFNPQAEYKEKSRGEMREVFLES